MKPFENESESDDIGGMTVENRTDRVELSGGLQITCDKKGLASAIALRDLLDQVIAAMQAKKDLPEDVKLANAPRPARSPFA